MNAKGAKGAKFREGECKDFGGECGWGGSWAEIALAKRVGESRI